MGTCVFDSSVERPIEFFSLILYIQPQKVIMRQSTIAITFAFAIAAFGAVKADLSEERVSDAWADFYKSYYEHHAGAEDRDLGIGHHHHSSSGYSAPAPVSSYDSPAFMPCPSYSSTDLGFKSFDFSAPETALVFGVAGLLAGFIAIATLITQANQLENICEAAKGVGNTALTKTATTDLPNANAAEITARLNLIEDAINAFATPDCTD